MLTESEFIGVWNSRVFDGETKNTKKKKKQTTKNRLLATAFLDFLQWKYIDFTVERRSSAVVPSSSYVHILSAPHLTRPSYDTELSKFPRF